MRRLEEPLSTLRCPSCGHANRAAAKFCEECGTRLGSAALHLAEALRRYGEELKRTRGLGFSVRMGLNSGEVVVGRIGDDLRMDYTAQGHTVGLAARMEQLAGPERVYLTEHTAALASGFF